MGIGPIVRHRVICNAKTAPSGELQAPPKPASHASGSSTSRVCRTPERGPTGTLSACPYYGRQPRIASEVIRGGHGIHRDRGMPGQAIRNKKCMKIKKMSYFLM